MLNSQTADVSLSARLSGKYKQDAKIPFLINIKDGRLISNSVNVRANPDYRPYTGNPKASIEERMVFIASAIGGRTRVIDSSVEELPPFDLGKATKEEIITFAFQEFGMVLSESTDIRTLRKQVTEAAERAAGRSELS